MIEELVLINKKKQIPNRKCVICKYLYVIIDPVTRLYCPTIVTNIFVYIFVDNMECGNISDVESISHVSDSLSHSEGNDSFFNEYLNTF